MAEQAFYNLGQMIGGYLHQDMDLEADSVPEAISVFAGKADTATRQAVITEMRAFLQQYHNRAAEEFATRWGHDFEPREIGQSVDEFFDMVTAILADPSVYIRYVDENDVA